MCFVKKLLFLLLLTSWFQLKAQPRLCIYKPPFTTIHFGTGNVRDLNSENLQSYIRRVTTCPSDGFYSYASFTAECFNDDWHTLDEDHTSGDNDGNMMLVNGAFDAGTFLRAPVNGFKSNTSYQFGVWMMNLCKPTKKCPFPLLANITIRLETIEGNLIAQFKTGELPRTKEPSWKQYRGEFTMPANVTGLILIMTDNVPGGCGNDFALDDITFSECVPQSPPITIAPKKNEIKKQTTSAKPAVNSSTPYREDRDVKITRPAKTETDSVSRSANTLQYTRPVLIKPPPVLTTRTNELVKQIETEAGEIKIDLYDNGEIDNDTVSIFHNNQLIVSRARLSARAITFRIPVSASQPYHEVIMVAENLGSIPPNTSLMIITAGNATYETRISSNEQKNAKVVFVLKK